ncbi:MAG: helix-turn-helix transcriptional regulator [Chloroflexi bacterium]|nr:helix-turn-helix transcriptional regulator [Chloroflexota bacterium]
MIRLAVNAIPATPEGRQRAISLGHAIRRARMRAPLAQTELARRLGVSQGTISFWERDIESPSLDHLLKLLDLFPDLLDAVRLHNGEMLRQLRRIERLLFDGHCACENCNCHAESPRE